MQAGRRAFLLGRQAVAEAVPAAAPEQAAARIGESCLAQQGVVCRTCGESCDAGAIAFSLRPGGIALPRVDTERCTGCGDCAADCPTLAIAMVAAASFSHPGN